MMHLHGSFRLAIVAYLFTIDLGVFAFAPSASAPTKTNAAVPKSVTALRDANGDDELSISNPTIDDSFIQKDFDEMAGPDGSLLDALTGENHSLHRERALGPKEVLVYDTSLRGEL